MKPGMELTVDLFRREMSEALKTYDKYIVCLDKTPDDCAVVLERLMAKAVTAFVTRAENMRHGIALDGQITVILSENNGERPLCGIYFNLHSPYRKKTAASSSRTSKPSS